MWGAHYLHDGAQPEGSGRRTRWGNCWVVVVLVVELDCLGGRPVGLPVLFRLFRPRDDEHPDRRSQPELGRALIDIVLERFPARVVELVTDGAYATRAWRGLPERVTVTTRMRSNAAVFPLAPPPTGKRGRPALKGARLASLSGLAASAVFTPVTITSPDRRSRLEHVCSTTCLWHGPFHTRPVQVMLIRKPDRTDGFDVAIASTDTDAATAPLIARYDSRPTIETAHQEAKAHGVGQARNRVQKARRSACAAPCRPSLTPWRPSSTPPTRTWGACSSATATSCPRRRRPTNRPAWPSSRTAFHVTIRRR